MSNRTYPHGVPCWIDTEQQDVEAAATFYGDLFGWTFEDAMPPGMPSRYLIATLEGADVCAIAGPGDEPASWRTYIAVDDADAAVDRLVAAGATMRSAPANHGDDGRGAVLTDPEGIAFRIWQARRRAGAQVVNAPGAWNFSDLHASDPRVAIAFYEKAFGWQADDLGFATMVRRPGYGDHLEATVDPDIRSRQAGVHVPPGFEDAIAWVATTGPDEAPRWHVSFAVADRDQTAAAAERLGAQVLRRDDTAWRSTALIRDPQGAEFTASQFTPPSGD
jgi:predicted enzyme related to lactoylglutathione lyase